VQVNQYVAPEGLFTSSYPYFSSYSSTWVEHARLYCQAVTARYGLGQESRVVEIASNDGYLLQHFPALGVRKVLGIEPSASVAFAARGK
jgi:hypothetical protein